jgi:hypothetical protein
MLHSDSAKRLASRRNLYSEMRYNHSHSMTDDIPHPDAVKERSDDHQQAIERAQHDESQSRRDTAWDCYE